MRKICFVFVFYLVMFFGTLYGACNDYSYKDLSFKCFDFKILYLINFEGTNLYNANFIGSLLTEICFKEACMCFADLHSAKFEKTNFEGADLRESKLYETDLNDSNFTGANLEKADLHGSDLSKANFTGAKLKYARLHDVKIEGAVVTGADFKGVYGLTNEQKQYLRDNDAINVPVDIEYDIEEYAKEIFDPYNLDFLDFLKRLFVKWFKYHFKSRNVGV